YRFITRWTFALPAGTSRKFGIGVFCGFPVSDRILPMGIIDLLILLCALGAGLVAGVFFAFSTFVMKALGRLAPPEGIAAMQSINIVVINPWFMSAFFGTALASTVLAVMGMQAGHPRASWLIVGGLLYVVGTIGVTMAFNVPRNNALAVASPSSPESA